MKNRLFRTLFCVLLIVSLIVGSSACTKNGETTTSSDHAAETSKSDEQDVMGNIGTNSFEEEAELTGWIGRGEGEVIVSRSQEVARTGYYSLFTEGRTMDWNGPGCAFPLQGGNTYSLVVWVYQDSGAPQTMVLSAEVTVDGVPGYQNVHRTECESGNWTKLFGTFRAGEHAEKTVIYVETLDAPGLTFYIDDVSVLDEESEKLRTDLPSLKEVYQDDFPIGCAVPLSVFSDSELMEFIGNQYNTFTHENELKPENVLDLDECRARAADGDETHPAVNIEKARPLLDFAKENGFTVNGHVLVWFSQTPDSFFNEGYRTDGELVDKDTMLQRMENYIAAVFEEIYPEYEGVLTSWDVVNEAVFDSTGELRPSKADDPENGHLWMDTVGADYIESAFVFARKYAPEGVKLFYNDYSVPYEPKLSGIVDIVEGLNDKGLIDGVGFQAHYQLANPAVQQITTAMQKFIDMGLRIRVTELDIEAVNNSEEEMMKQAKRYSSLMSAFQQYSDYIDAVIIWGISDGTSWKADQYPLLFTADMQPKYAFWALTDPSQLPPEVLIANSYGFRQPSDEEFGRATEYEFDNHTFRALHDEGSVYLRIAVADKTIDDQDAVTVYFGEDIVTVDRSEGAETDSGYVLDVTLSREGKQTSSNPFDILIMDNGSPSAWNDRVNSEDDRNMGKLAFKAMADCATAVYGKPDMSGSKIDTVWDDVPSFAVDKSTSTGADEQGAVKVEYKVMWQEDMLYVLFDVTDPHLDDSSATSYEQDSVEVFLDEGNHRNGAYEGDDAQYRLNFNNVLSIDHGSGEPETRTIITDTGFVAEMAIPLTTEAKEGQIMGFDVRYNNITPGGTRMLLNFWDVTDTGWKDTAVFGLLELK
ncbi:MAG: endo-1,4-beta-xylanase [Clostridiales bacterium]|nr:endo-1,4-beta-xylanase [Clostridiales bacterium]